MAKAEIEVSLRQGIEELGAIKYKPGSSLQGTVTVIPDNDVKCNHLYVRLVWRTEGRGTRYQETIEELDLFQGTLQRSLPHPFDFDFQLPEEPWSYEGHYISIIWAIAVQVDIPWSSDVKYEEPFVLRPEIDSEWAE